MFVPVNVTNRIAIYGTLFLAASVARGEILFEEVTDTAGIEYSAISFGASWGDFNADGWPDLWVGNHYDNPPSLFLNQRNGTFVDIAPDVWSGDRHADTHGSAWADFDNDGDQDLIELVGAAYGKGESPNHLYVNDNGVLKESAMKFGLAYPKGRGRTPLWIDADRDGMLDLVIMNMPRPDKAAPSAIFIHNKESFRQGNQDFGFPKIEPSHWKQIALFGLRGLRYTARMFGLEGVEGYLTGQINGDSGSASWCIANSAFATFANLDREGGTQLILCSGRFTILATDSRPFKNLSEEISLPPDITAIQDVAFGDFDGDGNTDVYMVRSNQWISQLLTVSPTRLRAYIVAGDKEPKEIRFVTDGELGFRMYGDFDAAQVLLGAAGKPLSDSASRSIRGAEFDLSARNTAVMGVLKSGSAAKNTILVGYDASQETWVVRSSVKSIRLEVDSTSKIDRVHMSGFESSTGGLSDKLLVRTGTGFKERKLPDTDNPRPCHSVVSGDFDNDMDLDFYLVCSGPATNQSNILYENIQNQRFVEVKNTGGAQGSEDGRGDSVVVADYDRDGFLDLLVTNGRGEYEGPIQLFRNKGNENHWIEVDLEGSVSNRDGIGAILELTVAGTVQKRTQNSGMHRYSQNFQRIHFGLGENDVVDYIKVLWPSGRIQRIDQVKADQILHLIEPL